MRRARIALFWAVILALSSGCAQQPSSETAAATDEPRRLPVLAVAAPLEADSSDSPTGAKQRSIASLPSTLDPPVAARGQLDPLRVHHARRDGQLVVALDDRTVMDQPLPKAAGEHWRAEIRSLSDGQDSLIKVVLDPAEADWLLQVAAIERTDIIYLTPSGRRSEQSGDESLIMLPPGQGATASLKAQLESIARATNLIELAEQDTKDSEGHLKLDVELRQLVDSNDQTGEKVDADSSLYEGTSIGFHVKNPNSFPVFVTVLFVDSRHRIHALFPRAGGPTGHLEASGASGDACMAVRGTVDASDKGMERLIVLGVKEQPQSRLPDFSFLAQSAPPAARSDQSPLQQLTTAAVFGGGDRTLNDKDKVEQPVEEHVFRVLRWPTATKRQATRGTLGFFREGSAEDLKAEIVKEQSGVYHTPNRTQAVLGTYGKLVSGNKVLGRLPRFEHRGLIQQIDRMRRFTTVQRRGREMGKDFLSFMGNRRAWQFIDLAGRISGGGQQEVEFELVGTRLDQSDVVRALNADAEALHYFNYLRENGETPCVVLEAIVMANYSASRSTQLGLQGNANLAITSDGVGVQVDRQRESSMQLVSPVIRCYQMCEVKQHQNRVVELLTRAP